MRKGLSYCNTFRPSRHAGPSWLRDVGVLQLPLSGFPLNSLLQIHYLRDKRVDRDSECLELAAQLLKLLPLLLDLAFQPR